MRIPVACSLSAADAGDRVSEWRELLGSSTDRAEVGPTAARLRLTGGDQALLRAVDLAEREKACCPFFEFSLDLEGGERWLRVSVPADAAPVLGDLVSLLPEHIRPLR